jgi:putative ABC transport system ATP-binding protein
VVIDGIDFGSLSTPNAPACASSASASSSSASTCCPPSPPWATSRSPTPSAATRSRSTWTTSNHLCEAALDQGRLDHRPSELSGGEQQRVAIARALITRPAIILADEPTGNLDTKNSDAVLAMLRRSNQELGQTVLMITHNLEAAAIADRILQVRDGQIVSDTVNARTGQPLPRFKALAPLSGRPTQAFSQRVRAV